MKVLLASRFLPYTGGREVFCSALLKALTMRGYEVLLVTTDDVSQVSFSIPFIDLNDPQAEARIAAFAPDVVHVHTFYFTETLERFGCLRPVPKVLTLHGNQYAIGTVENQKTLERALEYYDELVCVSEDAQGEITARGVFPKEVRLIPPAFLPGPSIDHDPRLAAALFKTNLQDRRIVLVPARFKEYKGVFDLVENIARAQDAYRAQGVLFAFMTPSHNLSANESDREEYARFASLVKNYGISDLVSAFSLDSHLSFLAYTQCSLVLLPSHSEQSPLSLMEAMYYMKPIIATRVGGVPDLLGHGAHGRLIEVGLSGLEDVIGAELAGRNQASLQASKLYVSERYHIDGVARQYHELYMRLLHVHSA